MRFDDTMPSTSIELIDNALILYPGLALAVGMILYISAINDEVGYRSSTSVSFL